MSFGVFDSFTLSMMSFFSAYFLIPSEYMPTFCIEKNEWQVIDLVMELCGCFDITLNEETILAERLE